MNRYLLIDDDEVITMIHPAIIRRVDKDCHIDISKQSYEALDFLNKQLAEGNNPPDFIFLDINMPLKNGLECLQEIRNDERFKELVIVMFSNDTSQEIIENSFENGANVYLSKSHNKEVLNNAIKKIITYTHLYKTPPFHVDNFMMKIE